MAETTPKPKIETITSLEDLPGGVIPDGGVSEDEAAEGLFDLLDSEFDDDEEPGEADKSDREKPKEADRGSDDDEDDDEESEEDDEESDESEDDDESDDGDEADGDEEDLFEVTLPGGEKAQVTLDELKAGYSRTADYTRKRQADAEQAKVLHTELGDARDRYLQGLERVEETLRKLGPKPPDESLREKNPGEYAAQSIAYDKFEQSLKTIDAQKGGVQEEISKEQQQEIDAYLANQWQKVVEAVPEWSDNSVANAALGELKSFAIGEYGFTEAEINGLADARLLLMLKQNFDLKKTKAKGKQKLEEREQNSKTRKLKPGAARTPQTKSKAARKRQKALNERADQTGSVQDAAAALMGMIDDLD